MWECVHNNHKTHRIIKQTQNLCCFILLWSVWPSYWEHWTNCSVCWPGVVSLTSALLAIISLLCW